MAADMPFGIIAGNMGKEDSMDRLKAIVEGKQVDAVVHQEVLGFDSVLRIERSDRGDSN
jgi:hypothetical protein